LNVDVFGHFGLNHGLFEAGESADRGKKRKGAICALIDAMLLQWQFCNFEREGS